MNPEPLKIRCQTAPWNTAIEFLLVQGSAVGAPILMQETDPNVMRSPTFIIEHAQAQLLMDDLWNAGIRPTEGTGSAGSLAATQRHLEDMRTLVFKGPQP